MGLFRFFWVLRTVDNSSTEVLFVPKAMMFISIFQRSGSILRSRQLASRSPTPVATSTPACVWNTSLSQGPCISQQTQNQFRPLPGVDKTERGTERSIVLFLQVHSFMLLGQGGSPTSDSNKITLLTCLKFSPSRGLNMAKQSWTFNRQFLVFMARSIKLCKKPLFLETATEMDCLL